MFVAVVIVRLPGKAAMFLFMEQVDVEEENRRAQAHKLAKLAKMEQDWRAEQQGGRGSWFWNSFATSFTSNIIENIQVGVVGHTHTLMFDFGPIHRWILMTFIFGMRMRPLDDPWEWGCCWMEWE